MRLFQGYKVGSYGSLEAMKRWMLRVHFGLPFFVDVFKKFFFGLSSLNVIKKKLLYWFVDL